MFPLECLEGYFSAGQAWPGCWGWLQEGQWTCTLLCQMGTIGPSASAAPGLLHHHPCTGRTRWHWRNPAELLTYRLSTGIQIQSSPALEKLAFTEGELGYLLQSHLLLNVVKAVAHDWNFYNLAYYLSDCIPSLFSFIRDFCPRT